MASEEDEDILLNMRAKLYRFDKEIDEWEEKASGKLKLLKHRKTGQIRLVMLQSKTLKIRANHFVVPSISFQEHAVNECLCVWYALDYADEELKEGLFCVRFASADNRKTFQSKMEEVAESQVLEFGESERANGAYNLVKKLSVNDQYEKTSISAEKREVDHVNKVSPNKDEQCKGNLLSEEESAKPKSTSTWCVRADFGCFTCFGP